MPRKTPTSRPEAARTVKSERNQTVQDLLKSVNTPSDLSDEGELVEDEINIKTAPLKDVDFESIRENLKADTETELVLTKRAFMLKTFEMHMDWVVSNSRLLNDKTMLTDSTRTNVIRAIRAAIIVGQVFDEVKGELNA